jgi:hypothetical protein
MGVPAIRIYDLIAPAPAGPGRQAAGTGGGGGGAAGGAGRKTLAQFCAAEGLSLDATLKRLEARGFKAAAEQTLREIAVNNGFSRPYELIDILRGETSRP